jgi:putative DNA primase/helicase
MSPASPSRDETGGANNAQEAIAARCSRPPNPVFYPPGYLMKASGLFYDASADEEGGSGNPLRLSGAFEVLANTRDEAGDGWGLLLQWQDKDHRVHRWAMPRRMLAADAGSVWAMLMDGGLFVASGIKARNKLADFLSRVEADRRALAADRPGWHGPLFVLPHIVYGEGAGERVVFQGDNSLPGACGSMGTLLEWRNRVASHAIGNSRLAVALASAFVGPLLALIDGEGGGLHFVGDTSTGKTTALRAAASVWGPPAKRVLSWRATANGLEGVAMAHSETFLCLDEMGQLDGREAGAAAYMLANGQGKARMKAAGGMRQLPTWRLMFLSTGETGLAALSLAAGKTTAAGQEVRILELPADAGVGLGIWEALHDFDDGKALSDAINDAAASEYGMAAPSYLAWLVTDPEAAKVLARNVMARFETRVVPIGASGMVRRAGRRFALLAAAGELARLAGVLPWPEGEAEVSAQRMFEAWTTARGGLGSSEEAQSVQAVRDFIERNPARFEQWDVIDEHQLRPTINRAGWFRMDGEEREYLLLAVAWKEIAAVAGLDPRRVSKALIARGQLLRGSDGKTSQSLKPPRADKTRLYVVRLGGGAIEKQHEPEHPEHAKM